MSTVIQEPPTRSIPVQEPEETRSPSPRGGLCSYDPVVGIAVLISVVLWVWTGIPLLPVRPWAVDHLWQYARILAVGLSVLCLGRFLVGVPETRRAVLRRHFGWRTLLRAFRWLVALEIVMTVYTSIKQAIPLIHGSTFDQELLFLERLIHLGVLPAWVLARMPSPAWWNCWWTWILDQVYYLWFPVKMFVIPYFLTHGDRRKRNHFLAAYLGVWILGVCVGLSAPSAGPCYVEPAGFPADGMAYCRVTQDHLAENAARLTRISPFGNGGLTFGLGIMAMPSLHITICILYVFFFWGEGHVVRWASILFALLIFTGSLASGWHYAIDGYAGLLIFGIVWGFTRRLPGIAEAGS